MAKRGIKLDRQDKIITKLNEVCSTIREDIKFAVAPKNLTYSPSTDEFIKFANEVWRLEQRIAKFQADLAENHRKGLESSLQKLKLYFQKSDIEIVDYTNQKFNEGLNLDVLSVEKDPTLAEPVVKETIEPTIMFKGQVVRKAKIIVISK
ncbi:MAG: nucleotide exchange factor GrpE [Nitrospiria bacterium]